MSSTTPIHESLVRIRQLGHPHKAISVCCFCAVVLAERHSHLLETVTRKLECVCTGCGILFTSKGQKYQRIPHRIRVLEHFRMTDAQWEALAIPIGIAFLSHNSKDNKISALYPSPAGPIESLLPLGCWEEISDQNAILNDMAPDVEGLLVNRLGTPREHFLIPIDECFKLIGIIRTHWEGISGGAAVWQHVDKFLLTLKQYARSEFQN